MLDRMSLGPDLDESRSSRKTSHHQNQRKLSIFTTRFRNALKKSVEGIIEAGRVPAEAKSELEHGQFSDWVVRELRFGTRKEGSREADLRKADMLMFLARNEVISNPCHWHDFPPSPLPKQTLITPCTHKSGSVSSAVNVRFAPKATEMLRCRELTRWVDGVEKA
jgi:hypothetical protein